MEVYFYFILLFHFLWFDKNDDDHNNVFISLFFTFWVLLFSPLPAASVCVTMLLLF